MADDKFETTEPSEPQPKAGKNAKASGPNKSKTISIFVGITVIIVALFQVSRISQKEMQQLQWEAVRIHYQQQMEFREKAEQRRFDTIENFKQADILESRFKPINQASLSP